VRLLNALLSAAVVGVLLSANTPATAVAGGVFGGGTASVDCFGCGTSSCYAALTVAGAVGTTAFAGGAGTTSCTANEPANSACVVTGSASGRVEGAVNVDFNWTRVGVTAVITTSGDINGAGAAVFVVTDPHGNPCGHAVQALVTVQLDGTGGDVGPDPLPEPPPEAGFNDGETGALVLNETHDPGSDGPTDAHDLAAGCAYKYMRQAGVLVVKGHAHGRRHPTPTGTVIRCRLVDAVTGVELFDQTRAAPGAQAEIEGVAPATANAVTVCTRGEGVWSDEHVITVGMTCRTP
jgi:hypothetical protein